MNYRNPHLILAFWVCCLVVLTGNPGIAQPLSLEKNRQGLEAMRQGDADSAADFFRQGLDLDRKNPVLQRNLVAALLMTGESLLQQRRLDEVTEVLDELVDLGENDPRVLWLQGRFLFQQRDYEAAEVVLLELVALQPENVGAWQGLAAVYDALGLYEESIASLQQALLLRPDNSLLQQRLDKARREASVALRMESEVSASFEVHYEGEANEELGSAVLDQLESAYAELGSEYNFYPTFKIPVLLYGNRDFSAVTSAPEWVAGLYDGKIRIPLGGLQRVEAPLKQLLYHEFSHVLIENLSRGKVPHWLSEGLAMYAGRRFHAPPLTALAEAVQSGSLIAIQDLETSFRGGDPRRVRLAYEQGYVMTRYLIDNFGWYQIPEVLRQLGEGKGILQVFSDVYVGAELTPDRLLRDAIGSARYFE